MDRGEVAAEKEEEEEETAALGAGAERLRERLGAMGEGSGREGQPHCSVKK
jgi:hypothetical protein